MNQLITLENINYLVVLLEGILSFLSPCILPLLPIYLGYLAGNGKRTDENGNIIYERKTVMVNTIAFVIGISVSFFLLGFSFSAIGTIFNNYKATLSIISGIFIIFMGAIQLEIIKIPILEKQHKLKWSKQGKETTPLIAFIMGFTFSFAWTPCIGPVLASVLSLASSKGNMLKGNLLITIYTIGFSIPFIFVGLFTTKILNIIKKNQKIMKYTMKIAGTILIIVGITTIINTTTQTQNILGKQEKQNSVESAEKNNEDKNSAESSESNNNEDEKMNAIDFTLQDQNGNTVTLSDLKGKVVFLNFWATWCSPCKQELPYIQEIYEEYGKNQQDVIILGIVGPKTSMSPNLDNKNEEEIKQFLKDYNITYPVLFDNTGKSFYDYYIQAFPTTFMIDKDGKIYGYVNGALNKETMKKIIEQTKENPPKF